MQILAYKRFILSFIFKESYSLLKFNPKDCFKSSSFKNTHFLFPSTPEVLTVVCG